MNETQTIRLLIVDDEEAFLNVITKRLKLKGFDVTAASDGEKAMEAAVKKGFDVAVIDLEMPGMNGQELLSVLKSHHQFLQVLILTGHGSIDSAMECMKLGATTYLEKPYDLNQLVDAIHDAYTTGMIRTYEHKASELKTSQKNGS